VRRAILRFFNSRTNAAVFGVFIAVGVVGISFLVVAPMLNDKSLLSNQDRWLLLLTFLLVACQTALGMVTLSIARSEPRRYEYVLLTVEFGTMSQYFASGELNRMSKNEAWEVVQILGDAILVRKPIEEAIWWRG
jgi:quinol-cytochrome oxidoreductase complex cytochrome b subunit